MNTLLRRVLLLSCMMIQQIYASSTMTVTKLDSILQNRKSGSFTVGGNPLKLTLKAKVFGDLNRLITAATKGIVDANIPYFQVKNQPMNAEQMQISKNYLGWKWYWSFDPQRIATNEPCGGETGKQCNYPPALTNQEKAEAKDAAIESIITEYRQLFRNKNNFEDIDKILAALTADTHLLEQKLADLRQKSKDRYLDESGEHLKDALILIHGAAQEAEGILEDVLNQDRFNTTLQEFLPSRDILLKDAMKDLQERMKSTQDPVMQDVYNRVKTELLDIDKVVNLAKRTTNSLTDAVAFIEKDIKALERKQALAIQSSPADDKRMNIYREAQKELALENAVDMKVEQELGMQEKELKNMLKNKYLYELEKDRALKGVLSQDYQKVADALQDTIRDIHFDLDSLQGSPTPATQVGMDKRKKEIKDLTMMLQLLEKDKEHIDRIQAFNNRKANELIQKHGSVDKALKILQSTPNHDKGAYQGLQLRKEQELSNNPYNQAVARLNYVKENSQDPKEYADAMWAVFGALLGQYGVSIDKLDNTTREKLAVLIQKRSQELINVTQNYRWTNAQKQAEQNKIVKDLLKDGGIILGAYISGASADVIATGNIFATGISAAQNAITNYLIGDTSGVTGPSAMDIRNAYKTLGLQEGASYDQVRAAYRKLALQTHPDKNPGDTLAPAKFSKIQQAYDMLKDLGNNSYNNFASMPSINDDAYAQRSAGMPRTADRTARSNAGMTSSTKKSYNSTNSSSNKAYASNGKGYNEFEDQTGIAQFYNY